MKILHIVNSLECGGLEKMVIHLASACAERGVKSDILCLKTEGALALEARQKNINVKALNKSEKFSWRLILTMSQMIRAGGYDVVHTHNFSPLIYGSMAARLVGVKCLNTRHGSEPTGTYKFIWDLNSRVIAVSEYTKGELLRNNTISEDKVSVIYNAIPEAEFNSGLDGQLVNPLKKELGLDKARIVGIVGRLSPEKDHMTLLKAMKIIVADYKNVCLLVVGDGDQRSCLEQYCIQNRLSDKVRFLGFRKDIPIILRSLDIFALSSLTEGVPLTILEAMASGVPVVATNVGGNGEIIENNVTGLLVPAGDAGAFEKALRRLLEDRDLAGRLAKSAHERVSERYSLNTMIEKYMEVYGQ
ncbi:MAG: glycosyltransferase [Candidatus Omnitrophica bacterium]|nr:glycosyltransferase [Candidatus Omnitrophota bacterium]MDE2222742.1 glycosyltransferase [Candidatus Omnitrophota bacterium]